MMKSNGATLRSLLEQRKAEFAQTADEEKKRIYQDGIDAIRESGVVAGASKLGDQAPNFTLRNAVGESVELYDYLNKGPVILTWYRGGWCPYCNLTLKALQDELPEFTSLGATLIALTPELPDKSISTAEKIGLEFEVLSDLGNAVAREYGVVFQLMDEVAQIYNKSFNMKQYNGDDSNTLPLAATYIINRNREIVYAFLDEDYRNRAEPSELTDRLKALR